MLAACSSSDDAAAPAVSPSVDASAADVAAADSAANDASDATADVALDGPPPKPALCSATAVAGDYCGNDKIDDGDPATLYTCPGPSAAPTKAVPCPAGCVVAPAGVDDYCKVPATANGYRLPWTGGVTMQLTQDCNDSCCSDHVGNDEYAWDWANGTNFVVRAVRGGTITHMKLSSTTGCATTACSTDVNMIVVDHGDGTQAIYMHLKGSTAQAGVTCGSAVVQGQALALAGTTGHSTGTHLHFQVSAVHASAPTCECGSDGLQCAGDYNPFPNVWVSSSYQTVAITFDEWATSSQCADRRMTMPLN